jgi:DNA-binding SARP family transcriptional activator
MLWTDVAEQRANSSLRSALWRTPAPDGQPLVQASNTHLWLNPVVDVDFRHGMARALAIIEGRPGVEGNPAPDDLGADLLPDWYEDWVLVEQERYRQLRLHALEKICEALTDAGRFGAALVAGLAAVACEPLRESAQRQVIRTHIKEGNLSEALRQYQGYARLLADELGACPAPALERLVTQAVAGRRDLSSVTAP